MSEYQQDTTQQHDEQHDETYDEQHGDQYDEQVPDLVSGPVPVEVRGSVVTPLVVAVPAAVLAAAYAVRATGTGSLLDWSITVVMGLVALGHLVSLLEARTPMFVADEHGVRLRRGRDWQGLPWTEIDAVEVLPRRRLRDGSVDVLSGGSAPLAVPLTLATRVTGVAEDHRDVIDALADLADGRTEVAEINGYEYVADDSFVAVDEPLDEPAGEWAEPALETDPEVGAAPDPEPDPDGPGGPGGGRPVLRRSTRADGGYGAPVGAPVPQPASRLGGSLTGISSSLSGSLSGVAQRVPDPRPMLAQAIGVVSGRLGHGGATATGAIGASAAAPAPSASSTPAALREPATAVRAELRSEVTLTQGANALAVEPQPESQPEPQPLRRPGSVDLVEDTSTWADRTAVRPIAREGSAVDPIEWTDDEEPAADPVVGPELAAARTRLGLSVDQLAERTRIRPHVIEAIEVDDFAPCGGDFYARGHLRTLARVLGIDVAPLLADYDERYADAPIDPRRVFEAELGSQGGAVRGGRGGPSWSVLVAAVMALVLAWSVVRLATDSTVELRDPVPTLRTSSGTTAGAKVPVTLTAAGGGAEVVVRDGDNKLVYTGTLTFGEVKTLEKVSQPVRVQSSDGSVEVVVGGVDHGALGATGRAAQNTFVAE